MEYEENKGIYMNKKVKVLILMCCLVIGMIIPMKPEAAAASTLKINGHKYPVSHKLGSSYSLKGLISSNYRIKRITAGIYNSSGKKSYYKSNIYPNTLSYNLAYSPADYALQFDRLKKGKYLYKVTAKDASGKSRTLVKRTFNVVTKTSKLKISSPVPSSDFAINAGGYYTVGGTIKSNYKITNVTAKVTDAGGATKFSRSVKPNTKTFRIGFEIDGAMSFNTLPAGTYKYIVTAKDKSGKSKTLVKRTLTVKSNTSSNPDNGSNGGSSGGSSSGGSSSGSTANFVQRTVPPDLNNGSYYSGLYNIYFNFDYLAPTGKKTSGGYNRGNCTWYACGRAREVMLQAGKSPNMSIFGPDPVGIWNANKKDKVYAYGSTPKVGSLVIFDYNSSGDAHIAMVEAIINGVPYVSESGYSMSSKKPTASNISFHYGNMYEWGAGRRILGYIYLI